MGDAPEHYSDDGDHADEILYAREFIFHWPYWHDRGAFSGLEGDEEEYPDEKDREDADGKNDEEPDAPAGLGPHVLEGDDVLRGSDGGSSTANVGRQSNSENESFREVGVGWKVA